MRNDKHVTVTLFSITQEDKCGNAAHAFYIKDPYVRNSDMDASREALRVEETPTKFDSLTVS